MQLGLLHTLTYISKMTMRARLRKKLDHKRDDFNFPIVNFPIICSNIPAAPAYGVYISQLIRYSRASGSYQDFLDRGLLLKRKLLNQGLLLAKPKASLGKFYGRHHDLVSCSGISITNVHGHGPAVVSIFRFFPRSDATSGSGTALLFRSTRVHPRF